MPEGVCIPPRPRLQPLWQQDRTHSPSTPQKVPPPPRPDTQQEVLPASLSLSIKPRPHSGGRWRPTVPSPLHTVKEPQAVPQPTGAPAPLTGRRARRHPPRFRCLGPGSCHRGLPGPTAPPRQRGSDLGGTRQGLGFPARLPARRPPRPASRTPRPWPAQGSAPPAPTAPRHRPGTLGAKAGAGLGPGPEDRLAGPNRSSALRRAGRLVRRAAAAACSVGLNLKRKKSLFRGGGGGAGTEHRTGRWPPPPPLGPPPGMPLPQPLPSDVNTLSLHSYRTYTPTQNPRGNWSLKPHNDPAPPSSPRGDPANPPKEDQVPPFCTRTLQ